MKEKYQKENLAPIVAESFSYSEVLRKIGMKDCGSNFKTIKKYIELHELDISHFTGQLWNKGLSYEEKSAMIPLEEILKENVDYKCNTLKKRLIKAGLKTDICECCGLDGSNLVLELHHINGNHYDNRFENLQILCPNCHSKTNNFRGRGGKKDNTGIKLKKETNKFICLHCGKEFDSGRTNRNRSFCCRDCYNQYLKNGDTTIKSKPSKEQIEKVINEYNNFIDLSKHFNVSKTSMRKYLQEYNLYEDFKVKYDFHAKKVAQYDLNWNLIKKWPSITDAEISLKIHSISKVINGKQRSAGGFLWRLIE